MNDHLPAIVDFCSPFASSIPMLVLALFAGHAIADFGLQSAYMATHKSKYMEGGSPNWFVILLAHCLIHAGMVAAVTGSAVLGLAELAVHFALDHAKNAGRTSYDFDQAAHYGCKIAWATILIASFQ